MNLHSLILFLLHKGLIQWYTKKLQTYGIISLGFCIPSGSGSPSIWGPKIASWVLGANGNCRVVVLVWSCDIVKWRHFSVNTKNGLMVKWGGNRVFVFFFGRGCVEGGRVFHTKLLWYELGIGKCLWHHAQSRWWTWWRRPKGCFFLPAFLLKQGKLIKMKWTY